MYYIIKKKLLYGIIPVVVWTSLFRPHKIPKDCKCITKEEFQKLL